MKAALGIAQRFVNKYASSKIANFINAVRLGWNSYSFIFYIGSISAILVGIFGGVAWVSVIVTILFFYYAGKFKEKEEKAENDKKRYDSKSSKRLLRKLRRRERSSA